MSYDISLIVPIYNDWINFNEMLLPSLLNQKDVNFELVVIDDGSDSKYNSLKREMWSYGVIDPSNVKYLELKKNAGANVARNLAFDMAEGKYIMFSDADVYFFPNIFKKMKSALDKNKKISFIYSDFFWKREDNGLLFPMKAKKWDTEELCKENYISFCSLVRKKDAEKAMPLDTNVGRLQDWDFWLTMMEKGFIGKYIEEFLFIALLKGKGLSAQSASNYMKWYDVILKKHSLK